MIIDRSLDVPDSALLLLGEELSCLFGELTSVIVGSSHHFVVFVELSGASLVQLNELAYLHFLEDIVASV